VSAAVSAELWYNQVTGRGHRKRGYRYMGTREVFGIHLSARSIERFTFVTADSRHIPAIRRSKED
jgi:hypothetical protein